MNLTIIKIGGHVIDEEDSLQSFLSDFAQIEGAKILIHGGGKIASAIGNKLGIETKMHEGRRITDEATRDLVTMVYAGLLNKKIVASLQANGLNSIGLTGADGNLLKAKRRPIQEVDFGFVGDVTKNDVNLSLLEQLLSLGMVPVIPALTHDGQGHLLNTNADTMAAILAEAMSSKWSVTLCYCFEHSGVLRDLKKEEVIKTLSEVEADALHQEGIIHSGMLPKLHNAFRASQAGAVVRIGHFQHLLDLIAKNEKGTTIK